MIIISDLENMTDALATDLQAYLSQPAADVWIFLRHPGGNARGKKLLDAIAKAGFPVIPVEPLKNDRDKLDFVRSDVRNAHRKIETEAAQALRQLLRNCSATSRGPSLMMRFAATTPGESRQRASKLPMQSWVDAVHRH